MDSGAARRAQMKDPRRVRILLGRKGAQWDPIWHNNPRIARPSEKGDFQIVHGRDPLTNMRPYHTSKDWDRWKYNLEFRPELGEIYLTDEEKEFGSRHKGKILIEPHIKRGASPNKQWGQERWDKLAVLCNKAGIRLHHMGPVGTKPMTGVSLIQTPTFRAACAIIEHARAFVFSEGGLHHAAAALGVKGVVIFGGYIAVETTGYQMHRNLGVHIGEACGMRILCQHCQKEMAKITPEIVLENLKEVLK